MKRTKMKERTKKTFTLFGISYITLQNLMKYCQSTHPLAVTRWPIPLGQIAHCINTCCIRRVSITVCVCVYWCCGADKWDQFRVQLAHIVDGQRLPRISYDSPCDKTMVAEAFFVGRVKKQLTYRATLERKSRYRLANHLIENTVCNRLLPGSSLKSFDFSSSLWVQKIIINSKFANSIGIKSDSNMQS